MWENMLDRCHNPKAINFHKYGGKGVSVCAAWRLSFTTFVRDMGMPPGPGYSLDREAGAMEYAPGTVRWATRKEQNRNRGDYNRRITFGGETLTLAEWTERIGGSKNLIAERLRRGWPLERALTARR